MTRRSETSGELNLVPIMNMVTILIPFLLMASATTSMAVIQTRLPGAGDPTENPVRTPVVVITDQGLRLERIDGSSEELPCDNPCTGPSSYDLAALTRMLTEEQSADRVRTTVTLIPEDQVSYETVLSVFDTARGPANKELFANVILGTVGS